MAAAQTTRSPTDMGMGKGRRPVINVSWDDARDYVEWLSRHTGKTYRLLTAAECEYAARASTTTNYAFGDKITGEQARFSEGAPYSAGATAEVGSFPANRFRLHDMHGNVGEWVADCWVSPFGQPRRPRTRLSQSLHRLPRSQSPFLVVLDLDFCRLGRRHGKLHPAGCNRCIPA